MFRRAIKQILAGLVYYSGLGRLFVRLRSRGNPQPLILMYHCILPDDDERRRLLQPGLVISPELFERQMQFLLARNRAISLDDLPAPIDNANTFSRNQFVVTFDDGWRDNYEFALPILVKLKVPATIFLSTDYIATTLPFWFVEAKFAWDKLEQADIFRAIKELSWPGPINEAELSNQMTDFDRFAEVLKRLDPKLTRHLLDRLTSAISDSLPDSHWVIDWTEAKEMTTKGITFGSHGQSHTILTQLDHERVERELVESKRKIEAELGTSVDLLAYPNGDCSEEIKHLARAAGYRLALIAGTGAGSTRYDQMALPRISIHEGSSLGVGGRFSKSLFACHLYGLF